MIYSSVDDLKILLLRLRPDSITHLSTANLTKRLEAQETRVKAQGWENGYTMPSSPGTTQRHHLLKGLVLKPVAGEILVTIGAHWDPALIKTSKRFLEYAQWENDLFAGGDFDPAFSQVLPTAPLCEPEDLQAYLPGWSAGNEDEPTGEQSEVLINCYSAVVYALAELMGYPTSSLTDDQAIGYREIVSEAVASTILLGKSQLVLNEGGGTSPAFDPEAELLRHINFDKIRRLRAGDYDGIF